MRYQVKYQNDGKPCYGIAVSNYYDEALEAAKRGNLLIEEAITGETVEVPENKVTDLPAEFNGEYNQYVAKIFVEAQKRSDDLGNGLEPGKLFYIGVADGQAYYEVVKVNKKTVRIEWRGYCGDRYTDAILEWGGSYPIETIEKLVGRCDAIASIFGRSAVPQN